MENSILERTNKSGETLRVFHDSDPCNPREWDNLATFVIMGSYSHLGDKHNFDLHGNSMEQDIFIIEQDKNVVHVQPIYAYSHSGLTISLSPFSCPWDSGVMGFLVITKDKIRECYGVKRVTRKHIEKAIDVAYAEIKTFDQYLTGDVYGFTLDDKDGNQIDSCWGFYGDGIEANGILDHVGEEFSEKHLEKS